MELTIADISRIIGISHTLTRNYLCLPEFEKKRMKMGQGNKFVYDLTNTDLQLLKKTISEKVRWFKKKKEK